MLCISFQDHRRKKTLPIPDEHFVGVLPVLNLARQLLDNNNTWGNLVNYKRDQKISALGFVLLCITYISQYSYIIRQRPLVEPYTDG